MRDLDAAIVRELVGKEIRRTGAFLKLLPRAIQFLLHRLQQRIRRRLLCEYRETDRKRRSSNLETNFTKASFLRNRIQN